jgi:GT2 family glycosyltransferase
MRGVAINLDVLVVNYRTPGDLREFLASFEAHPFSGDASLQILNVDPDEEDEEIALAWRRTHKTASWVSFYENVGYARAVNYGSRIAHGDTLAIFNADCVLTEGVLDACVEHLWSDPSIGVVGPRQHDALGRITHAGIFGTMAQPRHRGWREHDQGQFSDIRDAVTVSGSAYFVKRSVWDELCACPLYREVAPDAQGAFLPTRHYYEETWCSYHSQSHGFKVVYYGEKGMIHKWHRASPVGGPMEQEMATSQAMFRKACAAHDIECD